MILVAIVVLLFLQDWRAMILPMIDVPVSLIGTFAVMALLGFTLNNLTLFGLVLAIGIVVDDAIVVLENIERLMATGLDARAATIQAMEEITGPILAITLVLCAVFVPVCFLPGITGQFFRQFAVTIAVSTIISAINALTMTPSRAVVIFKAEEGRGTSHHSARPCRGGFSASWAACSPSGCGPASRSEPAARSCRLARELAGAAHGCGDAQRDGRHGVLADHRDCTSCPGLLTGLVVGWFVIRPVNAVLGWFFRGFNRFFDWLTAATPAWSACC